MIFIELSYILFERKTYFSIASYLCINSKELDVVSHSIGKMLLTPPDSRVVFCVLYTGKNHRTPIIC